MTRGVAKACAAVIVTFALGTGSASIAHALPAAPAANGAYGSPLIAGCSWATWVAQCQNLTVYSNGGSLGNSGCGPPNGCTFGPEFQCVELAQRYAYYAWGEPAKWNGYGGADGVAAHMWDAAAALPVPLQQYRNGQGVPPQQGDIIVFGPGYMSGSFNGAGHVSVVTGVGGTYVDIVDENGAATGAGRLSMSGTSVSGNGYTPAIGWLRNPVMPGSQRASLGAALTPDGQQQLVFWEGAGGHLREAWRFGGTWYGPADLSAGWSGAAAMTSSPSALVTSSGVQAVYWRGSGGDLWTASYSGGWSAPSDLTVSWGGKGQLTSAPSAATTAGGGQVVTWAGAAGHLWQASLAGGSWSGPNDLSAGWNGRGALTSAPAVAVAGGQQMVFWQGPGGHLWEAWGAGTSWNGPVDLATGWSNAGLLASAPSVALTSDGRQHVYWAGTDNHIWEAWYAGGWNGPVDWYDLGGTQSVPAAEVAPAGRQQLFWLGNNGDLMQTAWAGSWNGPVDWSAAAFGGAAPLGSAPSATVTPDGGTQLAFWQSPAGHLTEAWYAGDRWNGPVDWTAAAFGGRGVMSSAPSAMVTPDGGTQLVFWQGAGGHLVEAWWAGGRWNGPVDWTAAAFGGAYPLASAPSVAVTPDGGTQLVFWQGTSGHLIEAWWAGGRWNGPVDWSAAALGGTALGSAPGAAVTRDGTQQIVFWAGAGGHLVEAWWGGGRWNGPVDWTAAALGGAATLSSPPSVAVTPQGDQLVTWRGADGHLWETTYGDTWSAAVDQSRTWGGGAPLTSSPGMTVTPGGQQEVFWQGAGAHLFEAWWPPAWQAPIDWSGLGRLG